MNPTTLPIIDGEAIAMTDRTIKKIPAKAPAAPALPGLASVQATPEPTSEPALLNPSAVVAQPDPDPAPAPTIQTVEQGMVQTKHGFALYVPTQQKTLAPRTPTPLVLDAWVKNQIAVGGLELL
jgi:hypothetical protein